MHSHKKIKLKLYLESDSRTFMWNFNSFSYQVVCKFYLIHESFKSIPSQTINRQLKSFLVEFKHIDKCIGIICSTYVH